MRIKLSRMGWNNVLIFASMFMILLFNYSHKMMTQGQQSGTSDTLIPMNSIIQSIDFNGLKLERLGASWRTVSEVALRDKVHPALIVETWTQQPFITLSESPLILDTAKVYLIVVWVAGAQNGWVYEFVLDPVEQTGFVKDHQTNRWFQIDHESQQHLVPTSIIEL